MYYLSIGAIFKNESMILQEWIEHYIYHGVDHFFLIDDNSTDDFQSILQPYIEKGIVTLFQHTEPWSYYLGRQKDMYNHFLFPQIQKKTTKWLAILDIDEYLWSPMSIDLKEPLRQCEHFGQLQVKTIYFGSNGYIQQPKQIVSTFTKRSSVDSGLKYIINTTFSFQELTIHYARFTHIEDAEKHYIVIDEPYFRINHYCCQSQEYWNNIKCTRGDSDNYRIRTFDDFISIDINEIEDLELSIQNSNK